LSYQDGFEDATELCLKEVDDARSKSDAVKRIKYLLGLVKEDKFEKIKQMLGAL